MRVSLGSWSHEPPHTSISSICQHGDGEEERNPSESVGHVTLARSRTVPAPAQPATAQWNARLLPAVPSWGARTRISLSQSSLFLPEFDSPVRVLV